MLGIVLLILLIVLLFERRGAWSTREPISVVIMVVLVVLVLWVIMGLVWAPPVWRY